MTKRVKKVIRKVKRAREVKVMAIVKVTRKVIKRVKRVTIRKVTGAKRVRNQAVENLQRSLINPLSCPRKIVINLIQRSILLQRSRKKQRRLIMKLKEQILKN